MVESIFPTEELCISDEQSDREFEQMQVERA